MPCSATPTKRAVTACSAWRRRNEPAFYTGYAHEALARTAHAAGVEYLAADHVKEARRYAAEVTDADERAMLEKDLDGLVAEQGR
ncbi:MAG: hypothetical protein QM775_02865 [Pirellulales bacterium]